MGFFWSGGACHDEIPPKGSLLVDGAGADEKRRLAAMMLKGREGEFGIIEITIVEGDGKQWPIRPVIGLMACQTLFDRADMKMGFEEAQMLIEMALAYA